LASIGGPQGGSWGDDGNIVVSLSRLTGLVRVPSTGGNPQPLTKLAPGEITHRWPQVLPGARAVLFTAAASTSGMDNASIEAAFWILPLDVSDPDHPKAGQPVPFLRTPATEGFGFFSPDGRWIAYYSNESGKDEIYVRPASGSGGKWQVSTSGGDKVFWSPNGHKLFYETADNRIMVVDYTTNGSSFMPGQPRLWTDRQLLSPGKLNLALAPDGKRFAVFQAQEAPRTPPRVVFLLNFLDELKRRIR
jgi:WD40-like Beta Propeller Repeat